MRATGAAAQLVMESWAREYITILERSGLLVAVMAGYVDDGRQVVSELEPGMSFCAASKMFKFSEDALQEDRIQRQAGESKNQRMARLCTPAMNSINPDLKFTTECQEDFQSERLPTLDCEMWIEDNKIKHSYYQKPMKTPFVLMSRSGTSYRQKFQILSNELSRRLSNIQTEEIEHQEVLNKIEQFIKELKSSEYDQKQAREIVTSGLRGWKKKVERREKTTFLSIDWRRKLYMTD